MADLVRFRVRPVYHGTDLLIEMMDDHRGDNFPRVASILRDTLHATQQPHPDKLDSAQIAMLQDRFFSFWVCPAGSYEIDDDVWGLFVQATENKEVVTAEIERALLATGRFVKESVEFEQFR